jgi:hypothetical protein
MERIFKRPGKMMIHHDGVKAVNFIAKVRIV